MTEATHDWHEWHQAYDQSDSPLAQRLAVVQRCIETVLDAAPTGPIRIVSMCAGEGRDLLPVLQRHRRRADAGGRLVEIDPQLAATARRTRPTASACWSPTRERAIRMPTWSRPTSFSCAGSSATSPKPT